MNWYLYKYKERCNDLFTPRPSAYCSSHPPFFADLEPFVIVLTFRFHAFGCCTTDWEGLFGTRKGCLVFGCIRILCWGGRNREESVPLRWARKRSRVRKKIFDRWEFYFRKFSFLWTKNLYNKNHLKLFIFKLEAFLAVDWLLKWYKILAANSWGLNLKQFISKLAKSNNWHIWAKTIGVNDNFSI